MKTGEKAWIEMTQFEKETVDICARIIKADKPDFLAFPGVLELRQMATGLYGLLIKTDMDYGDEYFRVHEMRGRVEKLFKETDYEYSLENPDMKLIYFNFQEQDKDKTVIDNADEVIEKLTSIIKNGGNILIGRIACRHKYGHGDGLTIRIRMSIGSEDDCLELHVNEFMESGMKGPMYLALNADESMEGKESVVSKVKKLANIKIKEFHTKHQEGTIQRCFTIKNISSSLVIQIVRIILERIKEAPRSRYCEQPIEWA